MATSEKILKKIKEYEEMAKFYGAKLTVNPDVFYDDKHLDCCWYNGPICSLSYEGWSAEIGVYGEIDISGKIDGEEIEIIDRRGACRLYDELGSFVDDEKIIALLNKIDDDNYLVFDANNWIEINFRDANEEYFDTGDNVLETDDVLEAIGYIDYAIKTIEDGIKEEYEENIVYDKPTPYVVEEDEER